jgi:hypothetical protein
MATTIHSTRAISASANLVTYSVSALKSMNPYQPIAAGKVYVRSFPLLICHKENVYGETEPPLLETVLVQWARRYGYRVQRRSGTCWVLSRACAWWSIFAWRIEHVPTRIYCRRRRKGTGWSLKLVCCHKWAVAWPGDAARLLRELQRLSVQLNAVTT